MRSADPHPCAPQIAKEREALLKKYGEEEIRAEETEAQAPAKPEETRKAKSLRMPDR